MYFEINEEVEQTHCELSSSSNVSVAEPSVVPSRNGSFKSLFLVDTPTTLTPSIPLNSTISDLFSDSTIFREARMNTNNKVFTIPSKIESSAIRNPAVLIITCSRKEAITHVTNNLFSLSGINLFTVYLSMGCPDLLRKSVGNSIFCS